MAKQVKSIQTNADKKAVSPKSVFRGIWSLVKLLFAIFIIFSLIVIGKGIYDTFNGLTSGDVVGFFDDVGKAIISIFK